MDTATPPPAPHINLGIAGAGVCGASEAGAAVALLEAGYIVDNVAGTSAGSMLGAVIAARMPAAEIRNVVTSLNYPSFQQPANKLVAFLVKVPVVGHWIAWSFLGGAYKLDALRSTCDAFLSPLGSLTWGDHEARVARGEAANLNITSFNLADGELAVFPQQYEEELGVNHSDKPISEAISASVAIPTFFRPPRIKDSGGREWVYSDGGAVADTPYSVAQAMNPSLRTIAITISQERPFVAFPRWDWLLGLKLLLRIITTAGSAVAQREREVPEVKSNTIVVPTLGMDPNNFGITGQQASTLFDAGYQAAKAWIQQDLVAKQGQAPTPRPPVAPQANLGIVDGGLAA